VCGVVMMLVCTVLGFLVGLVVGTVVIRSTLLRDLGVMGGVVGDNPTIPCHTKNNNHTNHHISADTCTLCGETRVLSVTGGSYADCNGLYTLTNLSSIWDSKHTVYQRIAGGSNRFIYWNSHFYGEDFYGWSIGDSKSLVESGPFHSQGRGGVANQPWQGSWGNNITVQLVTCSSGGV